MKKIIMLIVASGSILLFSCTKKNDTAPTGKSKGYTGVSTMTGEDGDIIIINHKIVGITGNPIPGAHVTITNAQDISDGTTDVSGLCNTYPTHLGIWSLNVVRDGYLTLNKEISVVDSNTTRIDTMFVQ